MFLWCVSDGLPTLAPSYKLVIDASGQLHVPRSTAILCTLSKSHLVVLITWSPSGYTPVRAECNEAPSSSCLLIKMWQLTKALRATKNEPKFHGICYITLWLHAFSPYFRVEFFFSFIWNILFCLYCFIVSWCLFSFPSFASSFRFPSSSCIVCLACHDAFLFSS